MRASIPCFALAAIASAGCGPVDFHVVADGQTEQIVGMRSTHAVRGGVRAVSVCGEYPGAFFAMDTGGRVCVDLEFDRAALTAPATLTVAGRARIDQRSAHTTFTADATNSAALTAIVLWHRCLCANFENQVVRGTITVANVSPTRVAGTIDVTFELRNATDTRPRTEHVTARFDASGR